jgi:aryl-alcohol dehydrogenase-like predicted oxidoreductase
MTTMFFRGVSRNESLLVGGEVTRAGAARWTEWALRLSLVIPGTSSVQHLRANLQAATLTLPSDTLAKLEALGTKSEQKPKEDI